MDKIAFTPFIDVPLTAIVVVGFILHFKRWSLRRDIETSVDISARLPAARLRVILLFVSILVLCWWIDLAVWSIFALLFGLGLVFAVVFGGGVDGGAIGLFAAAFIVREWAFGFPQLILQPQQREVKNLDHHDGKQELTGKTGVAIGSIRPTGEVLIEGIKYSVASFDGGWIDAGTKVEVRTYRNGMPCVAPLPQALNE